MAEQPPLHRLYHHYSELPYSVRVQYTAALLVLGLGYMFALIYVFHTYAGRGTGNKMMLSYEDLVVAYSGSGHGSRLEFGVTGADVQHAAGRGRQSHHRLGEGGGR